MLPFNCLNPIFFHLRYILQLGYSNVKHILVGYYFFLFHLEPLSLDEIWNLWNFKFPHLITLSSVIFVKISYSGWGKNSGRGKNSSRRYSSWGDISPRGPLTPTRFGAKSTPPRTPPPYPIYCLNISRKITLTAICLKLIVNVYHRTLFDRISTGNANGLLSYKGKNKHGLIKSSHVFTESAS